MKKNTKVPAKLTLVEFAQQFTKRPIPEYGRQLLTAADRIGYDEISQLDFVKRGNPYPSNDNSDIQGTLANCVIIDDPWKKKTASEILADVNYDISALGRYEFNDLSLKIIKHEAKRRVTMRMAEVQKEIEAAGFTFKDFFDAEGRAWKCISNKDSASIAEDKTLGDCIYKAAKALGLIK